MADTYELVLGLTKNGKAIPGLAPTVRRLTCAQSQAFDAVLATGGGATALPIGQVGTVSLLLVHVDQPEVLALGNVTLAAGGLVLLWNATPATETIQNDSGSDAHNIGLAGGT